MILRLVEVICAEYRKAWEGIYPLELDYSRSEMQPQFANIATPTEIVVSARFTIEIGDQGGAIHFCIPYATLEPIRETLYSSVNANLQSNEPRLAGSLSQRDPAGRGRPGGRTGKRRVTIAELIDLSRGDFIELDSGTRAQPKVGRVPVFDCHYGASNGRYAVRIDTVHSYTDKPQG